jgi:hypothetical protein
MARSSVSLAVLVAGVVTAAGLASTAASAVTHTSVAPATVTADCAVLGLQGPGWAVIENACDVDITASVSLTYGPSPACVHIPGGGNAPVFWATEAKATNASEC